jgi:ligand-binding sensor domain-containing protein
MTQHYLHTQFYLLLLLVCFSSCNGQNKTKPQTIVSAPKTIQVEQSKMVKTQGVNAANNVHCGLQDKAGNLWFGTTGEGVYRFNGKTFVQFTKKDGLNSNTVWSMLEDKTGNIWFGTSEGLCRYDGQKISAVQLPIVIFNYLQTNASNNHSSIKNEVWSMMQDKRGQIWFGTSDGVYNYDGKNFTRFLDNKNVINKDSLHLKMVDCILEDKNGIIWFASGMPPGMEGVCRFDGKTITRSKPNGDGWIRYITEDTNGIIWFGGRSNGNFIYDPKIDKAGGKPFTNFTTKVGIGNSILADKAGNVWFTGEEGNTNYESKDGIWRYDGKTFTNFSTKDGMGKGFVHWMFEDKNGHIWIGTRNTGLYRFDGKTFTNFSE